MLRTSLVLILMAVCLIPLHRLCTQGDPNDSEGCKDPGLFNRIPGFYIPNCQDVEFDRFEFSVGPGKSGTVEGHRHNIDYYANDNIKIPSGLREVANYTNAAKAVAGQKVYEFEDGYTRYVTLKSAKNTAEVWGNGRGGKQRDVQSQPG